MVATKTKLAPILYSLSSSYSWGDAVRSGRCELCWFGSADGHVSHLWLASLWTMPHSRIYQRKLPGYIYPLIVQIDGYFSCCAGQAGGWRKQCWYRLNINGSSAINWLK